MHTVIETACREDENIGREKSKKEIAMAKEQTKKAEDKAMIKIQSFLMSTLLMR